MAKKQTTDFGGIITQTAADLYRAKAGERARKSVGGTILETVVDLTKDYVSQAEATKQSFLETFDPNSYEVELLPNQIRSEYTDFAQGLKNDVSEYSAIAGKYSANPNSEQYRLAVQGIENSKKALEESYNGYKFYAELRQQLLSNPDGVMHYSDEQKAMYDVITSEEGYKNLFPTENGLMYKKPNGDMIEVKKLGKPDFQDPELNNIVTKNILLQAGKMATNKSFDADLAKRTLQSEANLITSNRAHAHQLMFYGLNNDPDSRYVDYYILKKSADPNETSYTGIQFKDIDKNGVIDENDRVGGEFQFVDKASKERFNRKVNELKNDKTLDYAKDLNDFLVQMGMDQYGEGYQEKARATGGVQKTQHLDKVNLSFTNEQIKGSYDILKNKTSNQGSFSYNLGPKNNKVVTNADGSISYLIPKFPLETKDGEIVYQDPVNYKSFDDWWINESGWPTAKNFVNNK